MNDNRINELEKKYLENYHIDIKGLNVKQLIEKSNKAPNKKTTYTYMKAALELYLLQLSINYKGITLRRINMQTLEKNYEESNNLINIWKAYILHYENDIDLPKSFESIIREHLYHYALEQLGEKDLNISSHQKKQFLTYQHKVYRGGVLLKVLDKAIDTNLAIAITEVEEEILKQDDFMLDQNIQGIYYDFRKDSEIRTPKDLSKSIPEYKF